MLMFPTVGNINTVLHRSTVGVFSDRRKYSPGCQWTEYFENFSDHWKYSPGSPLIKCWWIFSGHWYRIGLLTWNLIPIIPPWVQNWPLNLQLDTNNSSLGAELVLVPQFEHWKSPLGCKTSGLLRVYSVSLWLRRLCRMLTWLTLLTISGERYVPQKKSIKTQFHTQLVQQFWSALWHFSHLLVNRQIWGTQPMKVIPNKFKTEANPQGWTQIEMPAA